MVTEFNQAVMGHEIQLVGDAAVFDLGQMPPHLPRLGPHVLLYGIHTRTIHHARRPGKGNLKNFPPTRKWRDGKHLGQGCNLAVLWYGVGRPASNNEGNAG